MAKTMFSTEHKITGQLIDKATQRFAAPYRLMAKEIKPEGDAFALLVETQADDMTVFYFLNWQFLGIASVRDMRWIENTSDETSVFMVLFESAYRD